MLMIQTGKRGIMRRLLWILSLVVLTFGCSEKNILQLNWDRIETGTEEDIRGVHFKNSDKGWLATASGTIFRTEDGGKTWQSKKVGNFVLEDVFFIDDENGFAVGDNGALFRTTDKGESWNDNSYDPEYHFYAVGFFDDEYGVVAGIKKTDDLPDAGVILTSSDGGATWQEYYNDMTGISNLFIKAPMFGWTTCIGSVGSTTDKGENWEKNLLDPSDIIRGAYFHNGQSGWIVGNNGLLAGTTDGGWSWQKKGQLTDHNLLDITFMNALDGLIVGEKGKIFLSTNSGINWAVDSNFTKVTLHDVETVDDHVFIAGDKGTLIHVHN